MGCTPSSPNNNLSFGSHATKGCTCQCHKNGVKPSAAPLVKPAMGSSNGRSQTNGTGQMESLPKEDPRIPLSGRQIFLIRRSWKGISRNITETGINMFLSLFEKDWGLIKNFASLQSIKTPAELRASSLLLSHVSGVMMTIDEAITNLDDANYTVDMLRMVGQTHTRFPGFDPGAFLLLKEPFLFAIQDTLGDRYTAHLKEIYGKAIGFILETLVAGFGTPKKPAVGGPTEPGDTKLPLMENNGQIEPPMKLESGQNGDGPGYTIPSKGYGGGHHTSAVPNGGDVREE